MKRRLKESIEIGDRVFVPSDEYQGTVVDINGDEVLVDGPFGEEYHNLSDLEKLGGDYEYEMGEPKGLYEGRKKVIRLTESDLARIVKRVISESKKNPSKSEILKMTKEELKDVYGKLEVKGEYLNPKNKGTFHNFKRTAIGDVVCSFRTDDTTPSGLKRNTQAVKVKNLDF